MRRSLVEAGRFAACAAPGRWSLFPRSLAIARPQRWPAPDDCPASLPSSPLRLITSSCLPFPVWCQRLEPRETTTSVHTEFLVPSS